MSALVPGVRPARPEPVPWSVTRRDESAAENQSSSSSAPKWGSIANLAVTLSRSPGNQPGNSIFSTPSRRNSLKAARLSESGLALAAEPSKQRTVTSRQRVRTGVDFEPGGEVLARGHESYAPARRDPGRHLETRILTTCFANRQFRAPDHLHVAGCSSSERPFS